MGWHDLILSADRVCRSYRRSAEIRASISSEFILDALRASGRADELQTVPLDDVPLIELRSGNAYKPSAQVSSGQRCTCIPPILLLRAASPLLIDQPEDNLDNAFIDDVVLRSIASAERARQLAFVTDNPNIPVLGEVHNADDVRVRRVAEHGSPLPKRRPPVRRLPAPRSAVQEQSALAPVTWA